MAKEQGVTTSNVGLRSGQIMAAQASGGVDLGQFSSFAEMMQATAQAAQQASPAMQSLNVALAQFSKSISDITKTLVTAATSFVKQAQDIGGALNRLVTAGLQGTAEGNRLSFAWMMFSRQIASVFLPVINAITQKLLDLAGWFRSLSGEAQGIIRMFGGIGLALAMIAPLLSIVSVILSPMALLFGALAGGLYLFFTQSEAGQSILKALGNAIEWVSGKWNDILDVLDLVGFSIGVAFDSVSAVVVGFVASLAAIAGEIASWIPGLGSMASAINEFADGAKQKAIELTASANQEFKPRDRKSGGGGQNNQVNPTGFAFESLSSSWERVMSAANKQDSIPTKQLAEAKAQTAILDGILKAVGEAGGEAYTGGGDY